MTNELVEVERNRRLEKSMADFKDALDRVGDVLKKIEVDRKETSHDQ
jgi:hypothetical protein